MNTEIATLKALTLENERNFSKALLYFLEHFAKNPAFLCQGKPLKKKTTFYEGLLNTLLKKQATALAAKSFFWMHVKKYRLVQGAGLLSTEGNGSFYVFEDSQVGMATVRCLQTGTNHFFRGRVFGSNKTIWLNPLPDSDHLH